MEGIVHEQQGQQVSCITLMTTQQNLSLLFPKLNLAQL